MAARLRLTERAIDALSPREGVRQQYMRWDGDLPGFGVRVSPSGAKTFTLKYRLPSGRVRWKTLGRVGVLTLDQARRQAKIDLGLVAGGGDPLSDKDAARDAITVAAAARAFLQEHAPRRKASTVRLYQQALTNHIVPRLGTISIAEVTTADAQRLHDRLQATPFQANRVLAVLSKLLSWSMAVARYRPKGVNPCQGIEKYDEPKRKRYLTEEEYGRLGHALRTVSLSPGVRHAIELLLLTGARPDEVASLQWTHVDLPGAALHLPDSKTGEKTIHLGDEARELLRDWPRTTSPYVFPGTGRREEGEHLHPSTLSHAWTKLRAAAHLDDVRLYDACRHSFASVGVSQHGLSLPQIGAQLGHTQPGTTQRYAHLHAAVARQHATAIGSTIAAALRRRTS